MSGFLARHRATVLLAVLAICVAAFLRFNGPTKFLYYVLGDDVTSDGKPP